MPRWWTIDELVERKLLPRRRLVDAVRSGALPVAAGSKDDDALIDLAALDWWLAEERGPGTWVEQWEDLRGTVHADGTRRGRKLQTTEGEERSV
jgi:hypothetical protein